MILDLGLAFAAGLLSFASTCVLPLVPAYVAYMGGQAATADPEPRLRQQARVLGNALLFVLGFSTAFVALGASAGLLGADIKAYRQLLLQIAGVALIIVGIALLGMFRIPWLMRERRLDVAHRLPRTPWASYLVGLAFAIGWTPCVGPILAAILIRAGATQTAGQGAILLAAYSAGLGIPFLLAAGLSGIIMRLLARVKGAYSAINAVAAVFLIGMGLLIFTNRLTTLNSLIPYFDTLQPTQSLPITTVAGPLKAGQAAPTFTVTDLNGQRVSLASLRGKAVLVTFWATWCGPCRQELPMISSAYHAHRDQGFEVVAINFGDESADTVRRFWDSLNLQPAPALDPGGRVADAYGVGLKTTGLPVTIFIARDGSVGTYWPFSLDQGVLDSKLKIIL
jgi:cytochrome c-type biogenesis protein